MTTVQRTISIVPVCFAAVIFIAAILCVKRIRRNSGAGSWALGAALFTSALTVNAFLNGAETGAENGYGWVHLTMLAAAALFTALYALARNSTALREKTGKETLAGIACSGIEKPWAEAVGSALLILYLLAFAAEEIWLSASFLQVFLGVSVPVCAAVLTAVSLVFFAAGGKRTAYLAHVLMAVVLFTGVLFLRRALFQMGGGADALHGVLAETHPDWNVIYAGEEKLLFSGLPAWQVAAATVLQIPFLYCVLLGSRDAKAAKRGTLVGGILTLLFLLLLGSVTTVLTPLVRAEEVEVLVGHRSLILLIAAYKSSNPIAAGIVFAAPLFAAVATASTAFTLIRRTLGDLLRSRTK